MCMPHVDVVSVWWGRKDDTLVLTWEIQVDGGSTSRNKQDGEQRGLEGQDRMNVLCRETGDLLLQPREPRCQRDACIYKLLQSYAPKQGRV